MDEGRKGKDSRSRKKRSRILYEITGLIVVILIISGLVTFFLVRDSQNKLIDKSIDKIIETEASNMTSTLDYVVAAELAKNTNVLTGVNAQQVISDMAQKKMTDLQRWSDQGMKTMVGGGLFNLEFISIIVPPSAFTKEAYVMISSDESKVYEWKVPDYIVQAMQAETPYLLREEGLPELGLEGTQLILMDKQENPIMPGFYFYFVSVIPMQDRIDSINAYYNQERGSVSLTLELSVFLSIIGVVIVIFFLLSYLIRKRITRPIDELAAEAKEIMEGNLDVDIKVHEGGEFQGMEQAFREMTESIRKYIAKATGEE
jgi:nitrogen fixation/metabolism regulation signal transduction histidine kinase